MKFLLALILMIGLMSCTNEEPLVHHLESSTPTSPYKICIKDALDIANHFMADIDNNPRTRSSRNVESVQVIIDNNGILTRSSANGSDTTLYLINYADDMGFALVSADVRTKPIYAISESGRLNLADTIDNEGLAMFFTNVREDIANTTKPFPWDTVYPIRPDIPIDGPIIPVDDYKKEVISKIGPLLAYYPSRWHQGNPLNAKIPKVPNSFSGKIGCGPIAVAMMASYFKHPSEFKGHSLNWDEINATNANIMGQYSNPILSLSQFFLDIAEDDCLSIHYDLDNPNCYSANFVRTFKQLGFSVPNGLERYTGLNSDSSAYPILVAGYDTSDNGHAWVVDGHIYYKITSNIYIDGYAYLSLDHCVWGWHGDNNGYYSWSTGGGYGSKPQEYDDNDEGTADHNNNYTINMECIKGIRINK